MPDREISDPEATLLADIATSLEGQYAEDLSMWAGSPFQWIKTRPSRQVGAIGEKLVRHWCTAKDLVVARSPDSEADLVISGVRVEVKYSSLWTGNGIYKFQQIRDQDYDYCFCLGISPFEAHAWFIPEVRVDDRQAPGLGAPAWWPSGQRHEVAVVSRCLAAGMAGTVWRHARAGASADLGGHRLASDCESASGVGDGAVAGQRPRRTARHR